MFEEEDSPASGGRKRCHESVVKPRALFREESEETRALLFDDDDDANNRWSSRERKRGATFSPSAANLFSPAAFAPSPDHRAAGALLFSPAASKPSRPLFSPQFNPGQYASSSAAAAAAIFEPAASVNVGTAAVDLPLDSASRIGKENVAENQFGRDDESARSNDDSPRSGKEGGDEEYDGSSSESSDDEEEDNSLALVPTQGQKMQYNNAVDVVLTKYLYITHAAAYATSEKKYEFLKRERRSCKLGPKRCHLALAHVLSHDSVRALEKYAPAGARTSASDYQRRIWWNERVNTIVTETTRYTPGHSRPLGSIHTTKRALLSAIEADRRKLGPWMVFGEQTPGALSFLHSLQARTPVPGHFGGFTTQSAHPIALGKVQLLMNVFSDEIGRSVDEILGGSSLEKFVERYNSPAGLAALEELSLTRATAMSNAIDLEPGETRFRAVQRLGNLFWLNLTNIIVTYNDIVSGLVRSIFGVYPGADGEDKLWMSLATLMVVQHCVGSGTVLQGFDPEDFERLVESCSTIVFEIFGHTNEPLVFDLAARKDPKHNDEDDDEGDADAYRKVPIPDTGLSRFARRVRVAEDDHDGLTSFVFQVRNSDKVNTGYKHWRLHRVYQIALEHHGLGFRNSSLVRKYLKLEDGQSFEDLDRFSWGADDEAYVERRLKHLERKGWTGKRCAKWSDIDHCVGRSKAWMNCPLFTIHCSHSWNQCMSYLRILCGDWGWGLAPKKYGTGND